MIKWHFSGDSYKIAQKEYKRYFEWIKVIKMYIFLFNRIR